MLKGSKLSNFYWTSAAELKSESNRKDEEKRETVLLKPLCHSSDSNLSVCKRGRLDSDICLNCHQ